MNIKSKILPKWETTTFVNSNKYTLGTGKTFQEQKVFLFDFSLIYKHNRDLKFIKNGFNFTNGTGTSQFSQFSYKLGFEHELIDQLVMRANYELRMKKTGDNFTSNSMIILNIGYKF